MEIYISESVANKLREKHSVSEQEVLECFQNAQPTFILDDRPEHRTTPPTVWFIAHTNNRRLLKIVFINASSYKIVKSAYPPSNQTIRLYIRFRTRQIYRE